MPIHRNGDPNNQRLDKWSSTESVYSDRTQKSIVEKKCMLPTQVRYST